MSKLNQKELQEPMFMTWGRIKQISQNLEEFDDLYVPSRRMKILRRLNNFIEKFNKDMDTMKTKITI